MYIFVFYFRIKYMFIFNIATNKVALFFYFLSLLYLSIFFKLSNKPCPHIP